MLYLFIYFTRTPFFMSSVGNAPFHQSSLESAPLQRRSPETISTINCLKIRRKHGAHSFELSHRLISFPRGQGTLDWKGPNSLSHLLILSTIYWTPISKELCYLLCWALGNTAMNQAARSPALPSWGKGGLWSEKCSEETFQVGAGG